MIHQTHCALRLGDNLAALQLVRKLAQANPSEQFVHGCKLGYYNQGQTLLPVIEDLPNIKLIDLTEVSSDSVDVWKGRDGWFYSHPNWKDYVAVMLDFYALTCVRLGLRCPILTKEDLLFDYPALQKPNPLGKKFDWLVINSPPHSGQFQGYNYSQFDELISDMCSKFSVVATYQSQGNYGQVCAEKLSITEIGNLSMCCDFILMVSTGPSWPTFNVWTQKTCKLRVVLLDNERLEFGGNIIHRNSIAGVRELFRGAGIL